MSTTNTIDVVVAFKIYTQWTRNYQGKVIGDKGTAETIRNGYVYVYRKLRNSERNDDGTRTRRYAIIDLSKTNRSNLSVRTLGEENNYFFMYSQIRLPEEREETIRLELNKWITQDTRLPNAGDSRLAYISLERDYTGGRPGTRRNLYLRTDYEELGRNQTDENIANCDAVLYLHDWYGQMEKAVKKYTDSIQAEDVRYFEEEVRLTTYNTHPQHTNARLLDNSNFHADDSFSRKELYALSLLFDKLVKDGSGGDSTKRINNLRRLVIQTTETDLVKLQNATAASDVIHNETIPCYRLFLNEVDEHLVTIRQAIQPHIRDIMAILEVKSADATFTDYLYFEDGTHEKMLALLADAMVCDELTVYPEDSQRFARIFENAFKDTERIMDLLPISSASELYKRAGEASVWAHIFSLNNAAFLCAPVINILDEILKRMKRIAEGIQENMVVILKKGLLKELTARSTYFEMTQEQMRRFFKNNKTAYGLNTVDDAALFWKQRVEDYIAGKNVSFFDRIELKVTEADGVKKYEIAGTLFESDHDAIENKIKRIKGTNDLVKSLSLVMTGYTIIEQACFIKECDSLAYAIPHWINMAGSFSNIIETRLAAENAARIAGAVGWFLLGLESAAHAFLRGVNNDSDAMGAYIGSAALFATAGFVALGAGPGLVVYGFAALGLCLNLLARHLTDDDRDIFLKYSLWGTYYREDWTRSNERLTSWWPKSAVEFSELADLNYPIKVGPKTAKGSAYLLYDIKRNIIRSHTIFIGMMEIPDHDYSVFYQEDLFNCVVPNQVKIELALDIFGLAERIEIRLRKFISRDRITGEKNYETKENPDITIELSDPESNIYFYRNGRGIFSSPSHTPIESMDDIDEAGIFKLLCVPSKRVIVSKYNEYRHSTGDFGPDIRRIEDIHLPIPKGILENRCIGERGREYLFETTVYFKLPNYRPLQFAEAYTLL